MGILSKFFKSGDVSTKNSKVNDAIKVLQNGSLSDNERVGALAKLKSIFLTSGNKDDLKVISQSMTRTIDLDKSNEIRKSALKTLDAIIENCLFFHNQSPPRADAHLKLSIVSGYAVPVLIGAAKSKNEDAKELRLMAFRTLSKIAPFAIDEERIVFLARSLNDQNSNIRMAVIAAFDNLVNSGDDALKRRMARFSLAALCEALDDPAVWIGTAKVLGELGTYALGAAPFLFKRLDDKDGEWAALALRKITGEEFGKDEKHKWEQWLQKYVVK